MPRSTASSRLARAAGAVLAAGAAILLLAVQAAPAAAHEERTVGRYTFAVGFGDEPAYAGARNSVQVLITDAGGKPVTAIGDRLRVMIMAAGKDMDLRLEPYFEVGEWGIPGDYRAFFIPTAPGSYSFHLHGALGGQKVEQRFTSGPKTFGDVEDPARVAFPVKQPSSGQLAQRLDREVPRLGASLQAALAAERSARRTADQAWLLALAAAALGVLGLVTAGVAVARARRRPGAAARSEVAVGAGAGNA